MKYAILVIDNSNGILSEVISNQEISLTVKNSITIAKDDKLIGYINYPVSQFRMLFSASRNSTDNRLYLSKKIDVAYGVSIEEYEVIHSKINMATSSGEELVEISKAQYDDICMKILKRTELLKEDRTDMQSLFEKYLEEKQLGTARRYVSDLKSWSDKLVTQGVIDENIFSYSASNEFEKAIEKIKLSTIYREYRNEKKERNPNSGLSIDAALTNYLEFLRKYESQINTCEIETLEEINVTAPKLPLPFNYLVFGAPGTGKSHTVKELQEKYFPNKECYERVTFYSNYSYANFVGTYKPQMDGKEIVYSFVPGPFMRILEKAYKNPDKNYLLVIEEINRANPAAVFGDVFQLLDRKNGKSEYEIETSEDLRLYLSGRFVEGFDSISDIKRKEGILMAYSKLYIPQNMYICATMNSADQGVFPMDTAFKRRWDFKYIGINENQNLMDNVYFMSPDKNNGSVKVNWNKLRNAINEKLSGPQCKVNEDKLLGPFFISSEIMKMDDNEKCVKDNELFIDTLKNKVIMYLFEDAAKQRHTEVFKGCENVTRFSSICDDFEKIGIRIFGDEIASSVIGE